MNGNKNKKLVSELGKKGFLYVFCKCFDKHARGQTGKPQDTSHRNVSEHYFIRRF